METWAAICIGVIAGIFYALGCRWLVYLEVDDPVEGVPVHLINGAWGLVAAGFFDN